jgi:hypothetical protein
MAAIAADDLYRWLRLSESIVFIQEKDERLARFLEDFLHAFAESTPEDIVQKYGS